MRFVAFVSVTLPRLNPVRSTFTTHNSKYVPLEFPAIFDYENESPFLFPVGAAGQS